MPSCHSSSLHETESGPRDVPLVNQESVQQVGLLSITPEDLSQFTALYQKHTGISLTQGEASVKAQRLLSLVRIIAPYAEYKPDLEAPAKI